MSTQIWREFPGLLSHRGYGGTARRLNEDEVRTRVLDLRPEWLAEEIHSPYQATNISDALHRVAGAVPSPSSCA